MNSPPKEKAIYLNFNKQTNIIFPSSQISGNFISLYIFLFKYILFKENMYRYTINVNRLQSGHLARFLSLDKIIDQCFIEIDRFILKNSSFNFNVFKFLKIFIIKKLSRLSNKCYCKFDRYIGLTMNYPYVHLHLTNIIHTFIFTQQILIVLLKLVSTTNRRLNTTFTCVCIEPKVQVVRYAKTYETTQ